jgi:dipeptidyl aminopeptidase/acylaminoacyl peptidase
VKSIKQKGGRVQYILFEGEGHGWRKAETIKRALEAELAWYEDVFCLKK